VEIETILTRAYAAGAREAGYALLRLPLELRDMFREKVLAHYPDKLRRAVSLVQSMDDDRDGDAQWPRPKAGSGAYAWMIRRRFETAARRLGYRETPATLSADLFRKPASGSNEAGARRPAGSRRAEPREGLRGFPDQVPGRP
jgi:DNA repair photolyase